MSKKGLVHALQKSVGDISESGRSGVQRSEARLIVAKKFVLVKISVYDDVNSAFKNLSEDRPDGGLWSAASETGSDL